VYNFCRYFTAVTLDIEHLVARTLPMATLPCAASYYLNGRTARLEDMMSVDVLNSLNHQLSMLKDTVAAAGRKDNPLWLGETSSCWGGGAPDLSDRYVAGFM